MSVGGGDSHQELADSVELSLGDVDCQSCVWRVLQAPASKARDTVKQPTVYEPPPATSNYLGSYLSTVLSVEKLEKHLSLFPSLCSESFW